MTDDNFRNFLYYVLGFLPSLFFSLRFLIQWVQSERLKTSYVDAIFWRLSITGNIIAFAHYFIQLQFVFMLAQAINAFIAWRNLNLMKKPLSTRFTLALFGGFIALVCTLFFAQTGSALYSKNISGFWHLLGSIGALVFASRFWIQWYDAETRGKSALGTPFWVLSILGGALTLIYSLKMGDVVSIVNYTFPMIPYTRNLMLLRKKA